MSSTIEYTNDPTEREHAREQRAVAHIGWRKPRPHSVCGAPILGVPAEDGYPVVCNDCLRIWSAQRDGRLFT